MSQWKLVQQQYPTKHDLTEQETHHLLYTTKESFVANIRGDQILFARFEKEAIYSREVGHMWKFEEDREIVNEAHFKAIFVD
jgi:hypothetical protein